ncbi:HEPN domain-containing protein [Azospirillum isscasi]|uniref:HEPN domain-containing protein n=1 Tax=Azospirillum isscasi TaxID=3053926 RepID=A0ABU0WB31_9PROT|nr:HEPN domain-containing protein [Azospirillum isscasi]MDQ2101388.1 HEPN domain-containing protein [Azospirillum isscasi]
MAHRVGPGDWIATVDEDIRAVELCLASDRPAIKAATYHCQQAAEKLVKAVLVSLNIDFSKTHDIDSLIMRIPAGEPARGPLCVLGKFTAYATLYRYPGEASDVSDDPTLEEAASWLSEIQAVRMEVMRFLNLPG